MPRNVNVLPEESKVRKREREEEEMKELIPVQSIG